MSQYSISPEARQKRAIMSELEVKLFRFVTDNAEEHGLTYAELQAVLARVTLEVASIVIRTERNAK